MTQRGQAKALDIWRMETKVEVLFEEVLNILAGPGQGSLHPPPASPALSDVEAIPRTVSVSNASNVQDVFAQSAFKHIRSIQKQRFSPTEDLRSEI